MKQNNNEDEFQNNQTPGKLLRVGAAAEFLGMKVRTLQGWRYRGEGPPFIRLSVKSIRYRKEDLIQWVEQNLVGEFLR